MSNPLGKLSHIGIALEKIWGTAVAALDYLKFSSESLSLSIEDLVSASVSGRSEEPESLEGLGTIAGETVHEVHPVGAGYLLRSWFGQPLTSERSYFVVIATNKYLDFDIGALELNAEIATGSYPAGLTQADAGSLCKAIYDAIVAVEGVSTYTVSYSRSTKKFTITSNAATFQILWKTGTHGSDGTDTHIGSLLGFSDAADDTGAVTYTADNAVDSAYQHIFTPVTHIVPTTRKGTATAGTTTSLTDSGQTWVVDQWIGWFLHIVEGTGAGQYAAITDSNATSVTFDAMIAPSTDSVYEIIPGPENSLLPSYTLEIQRDLAGSVSAFQFQGLVANTLSFVCGVGTKLLQLTAGWLGKDVINIEKTVPVMPETEPYKWSGARIGIGSFDSGVATGGSATTIIDSAASWTVDSLIGKMVLKSNAAGTKHEIRPITDNDATTITVSPGFVDAGAATDVYEIFYSPDIVENLEFSLDNGLVSLPTLNATKRVSRIVGDAYRTGTLTATVIPQDKVDFETYFKGWTSRKWLIWFKGDAMSGNNYNELVFIFPKVLMTAYPINIGGGGRITVSIAAKLKYDSTAGNFAKVMLYNLKSNYGF